MAKAFQSVQHRGVYSYVMFGQKQDFQFDWAEDALREEFEFGVRQKKAYVQAL